MKKLLLSTGFLCLVSLVSAQSKIVVFEAISEKEKMLYISRPFQIAEKEDVKAKFMSIMTDKTKDWSSYVSDVHEFANTMDGDKYTRKQISTMEPKGYKAELITVK